MRPGARARSARRARAGGRGGGLRRAVAVGGLLPDGGDRGVGVRTRRHRPDHRRDGDHARAGPQRRLRRDGDRDARPPAPGPLPRRAGARSRRLDAPDRRQARLAAGAAGGDDRRGARPARRRGRLGRGPLRAPARRRARPPARAAAARLGRRPRPALARAVRPRRGRDRPRLALHARLRALGARADRRGARRRGPDRRAPADGVRLRRAPATRPRSSRRSRSAGARATPPSRSSTRRPGTSRWPATRTPSGRAWRRSPTPVPTASCSSAPTRACRSTRAR